MQKAKEGEPARTLRMSMEEGAPSEGALGGRTREQVVLRNRKCGTRSRGTGGHVRWGTEKPLALSN